MTEEMLNGIKFAHFDQDSSTFNSISENNSILYKLEVRGSNSDSSKQTRIRFNGVEIETNYERGLNLRVLSETGDIIEEKVFYGRGSSLALREYLDGLTGDYIIAIASHDELYPDPIADEMFNKLGSASYPNSLLLSQIPRVSYSAIYSNKLKKIVCEGMQVSNGSGVDSSIQIEKVYDTIDDLAVTGVPLRVIDDLTEYQSDSSQNFEMVQYPPEETYISIEEYNIKSGDMLLISCDFYRDEEAKNANIHARFFHNYFSDGVYKTGIRISGSQFNNWEHVEKIFIVPDGVDSVVTGCMRYPANSDVGIVKVKNILITHISQEVKQDGNTSFGVNGIRTTSIQDNGDFTNPVMQLLRLPIDNKKITSNNFKEFPID